jgi:hypothetical protein
VRKRLALQLAACQASQTAGRSQIESKLQRRMEPFGAHRLVADFKEQARELVAAA